MKRNRVLTFFTLLCGLLFHGCSSEEDDVGDSYEELPIVTLSAYTVNDGDYSTRTVMNTFGNLFWDSTDTVCVNGRKCTEITISDAGAKAKFTVAALAPYYIVYPVYKGMVYDSSTHMYSFDFPSSQPYCDNTTFANGVNPSVAVGETEDVTFYNVCGVLKAQLKVQLAGVKKVRFLSAGKFVAGSAMVNPLEKTLQIAGGTRSMDIVFDIAQTLRYSSTVTVRWVLPVGDYEPGWSVQLLDINNNVITEKIVDTAFSITRSQVKSLGLFTYMSGGGEGYSDGNGNHEEMGYTPNYYSFGDGNHDDIIPGNIDWTNKGNHEGMNKSNNDYAFGDGGIGNHDGTSSDNTTPTSQGNHDGTTSNSGTLPGTNNHEGMKKSNNDYVFGDGGIGNHDGTSSGNTTPTSPGNHDGTSSDNTTPTSQGNHDGTTSNSGTLPGANNHEGMKKSNNDYVFGDGGIGNHDGTSSGNTTPTSPGNHDGTTSNSGALPETKNHEGMKKSNNDYVFGDGGNHEVITPENIVIEPEK